MKIYNPRTQLWLPIPGRVYTVDPAPWIAGADLFVVHKSINNKKGWTVTHVLTSTAVAHGATRKEATSNATEALQHAGRAGFATVVKGHLDAGALCAEIPMRAPHWAPRS